MSSNLHISHLSLSYNQGDKVEICKDFNFNAEGGEIIGILGPNGSGKTTLLNALLGFKEINEGAIDLTIADKSSHEITYIPQAFEASFFPWINLRNNIRLVFPSFYKDKNVIDKSIDEWKAKFQIEFDLDKRPRECSGGMLQQAAILRAFSVNKGVILADEPFSALDISISHKIRSAFRASVIEKKLVCIVVLHDLEDLVSLCDRVIIIPNKPYTTEDYSGYNKVQIVTNERIQEASQLGEASLVQIAEDFFKIDK